MPSESISQIPQQAIVVNGAMDLLEISQWTGNISAPYVTKKINPSLLVNAGSYITGEFTLLSGQTTTPISIPGLRAGLSRLSGLPAPLTAHAAASVASTWYTINTDQLLATHANNSQTDRRFSYAVII